MAIIGTYMATAVNPQTKSSPHSGLFLDHMQYMLKFCLTILFTVYKSNSESEKSIFLMEKDEKASLHLETGMVTLYLLKDASFGAFG